MKQKRADFLETRANYLLIGAFTLLGFVGLLVFSLWFAKIEIDRQFDYYDVLFPDVSGLDVASDVRFAGLPVGKVIRLNLVPGDGRVRVRLEVTKDTPVRQDSRASVEIQGVTGVSNVLISAGSQDAALLSEGAEGVPVIPAQRSALQALGQQGPEMLDRLSQVAGQLTELFGESNRTRVANILSNIEASSANLDQALTDISQATGAIASAAEDISSFGSRLDGLSDAAQTSLGTAQTLMTELTETATKATTTFDTASATLKDAQDYLGTDLRDLTQQMTTSVARLDTSLSQSLTGLDGVLESSGRALSSAERVFDGADRAINTDLGPALADLREVVSRADAAIDLVAAELPNIVTAIGDAANSADTGFGRFRDMVDKINDPVQAFARDGLPQITQIGIQLRGLVDNINQLVSGLRRNPSQILTAPNVPEFRR